MDIRKAGKIVLVANFVLAAGIVAAGTDLFSPVSAPVRNESVFREIKPPSKQQGATDPDWNAYSDVTSDRFRALRSSGAGPSAAPGVEAALQNSYRVTGTMISNNEKLSCAVIEDIRTRAQHTVFVGDVVGPVEIVAIHPEEIEVRMQDQLIVMRLDATAPARAQSPKGRGKNPGAEKRARAERIRGERRAAAPEPQDAPKGGNSPAPANLAGVAPELLAYWEKLPAEERKRWEQWWNSKPPEERKKWEARLLRMARGEGR